MRWTGSGHENIRATHHKTLEFTAGDSITERATCIIAVAAHPSPAASLAGRVTITVEAGGQRFAFDALANSSWDPLGPAVIRRSPLRLPGTFATHATASAADLPRELVAALADPAGSVDVSVQPSAGDDTENTVVLFAADPSRLHDPRLIAELEAADIVIAEDDAARRLIEDAGGRVGEVAEGRRTLVVATSDLPGATVSPLDVAIEVVGLPASLAVAAASPHRAPLVIAPDGADLRGTIRATPASHRLRVRVLADELGSFLDLAARERGTAVATVAQPYAPPMVASPQHVPALPSKEPVYCCLHAAEQLAATAVIDPAARAAVTALLADGVSTRTAARALAELTGWPRRHAYDAVLAMSTKQANGH